MFGIDALNKARSDLNRAGKPLELEEGDVDSHLTSPGHLVSMAAVLRNRTECDRILRRLRPSEIEKQLLQKCKAELQRVLRLAAIWWTGSIGKGTSLSGSHDVDVCVRLGDSYAATDHALQEIARRLQHSDIEVKRVEKKLVFAIFKTQVGDDSVALELDILPDAEFGRSQVRHFQVFSDMSAAKKDAVRILKALSRLSVKVPGILLETVVHRSVLHSSVASHVQGYVVEAFDVLSSKRRWPDPTDRSVDLGQSLDSGAWDKLQSLAKDALAFREVQLEPSKWCKQAYPCIHGVKLIDAQRRVHDLGEHDGYDIVEMCTRLGLRIPSHFKNYPKVKDPSLRQEACEHDFWSFWREDHLIRDLRKRSIQLGDKYLDLVKQHGDTHHPQVLALLRDFESLLAECSGHPSAKVQTQVSVLCMFFVHKLEEAQRHVEVAAKEEAERNARAAAMRAEARRARQHIVVMSENHGDVQNANPCDTMFFFVLLFAMFVKWLSDGFH
jgi:hypothetical protein